jgi:hypothetical protein
VNSDLTDTWYSVSANVETMAKAREKPAYRRALKGGSLRRVTFCRMGHHQHRTQRVAELTPFSAAVGKSTR